MHALEPFVLKLLHAAGTEPRAIEEGRAYRCAIPRDLAPLFRGKRELHFTFDEEYFDEKLEEGVEFVAPGYPLLDRLIGYAQSRFIVSEASLSGVPLERLELHSERLKIDLASDINTKPFLCFHLKLVLKSDEYAEELLQVWVDARERLVLPEPPPLNGLQPCIKAEALNSEIVGEAWEVVLKELEHHVGTRVKVYEETANLRLGRELTRLERAGLGADERERTSERYRLTVGTELVFAEVLHYPVQHWGVTVTGRDWTQRLQYRYDTVQRRFTLPPRCPVCRKKSVRLEPCDSGKHVVCPTCAGTCHGCGRGHCTNHPVRNCYDCFRGHCEGCLSDCHLCGEAHCPTCLSPCTDCGKATGNECLETCGVCDHRACKAHYAYCHLTQAPLCVEHTTRCDRCERPTHAAKLHEAYGRTGRYCESCLSPCREPHPMPRYLHADDARYCAGTHAQAYALCPEHRLRCALHTSDAYFCDPHLRGCHTCDRSVCAEHGQVSSVSGSFYCADHLTDCRRCGESVGHDETVTVRGGGSVCHNCALHCPECEGEMPWSLEALLPCPHCLKEGLQAETIKPQGSADALKRNYPHIVRCPEHRLTCHVCHRAGCTEHVSPCSECGGLACIEDTLTLLSGRRVCRTCARTCVGCPPDTYHLFTEVKGCCACGKDSCNAHRNPCEDCLGVACPLHSLVCRYCESASCSSCAPDGVCLTCQGFDLVTPESLPRLPYARRLHGRGVLFSSRVLPNGEKRQHLMYYPEPGNLWGYFGAMVKTPQVMLEVFETKGRETVRVRTVTLKKAHPDLPNFNTLLFGRDNS